MVENINKYKIISELEVGYKAIDKAGQYVIVDKFGNTLTERGYDRIFLFKGGVACVELDNKFGFINKEGREFISCEFDKVILEDDSLVALKSSDFWEIFDTGNLCFKNKVKTLEEVARLLGSVGDLDVIG